MTPATAPQGERTWSARRPHRGRRLIREEPARYCAGGRRRSMAVNAARGTFRPDKGPWGSPTDSRQSERKTARHAREDPPGRVAAVGGARHLAEGQRRAVVPGRLRRQAGRQLRARFHRRGAGERRRYENQRRRGGTRETRGLARPRARQGPALQRRDVPRVSRRLGRSWRRFVRQSRG